MCAKTSPTAPADFSQDDPVQRGGDAGSTAGLASAPPEWYNFLDAVAERLHSPADCARLESA